MSNRRLAIDAISKSLKGKAKKVKGKAKATIGGLTEDRLLQAEGRMDEVKGALLETVGKVERKIARKL
jgi:uncharacterized protein YjbJ (UPF0337 family)